MNSVIAHWGALEKKMPMCGGVFASSVFLNFGD